MNKTIITDYDELLHLRGVVLKFATKKHLGQQDKALMPYINHPVWVSNTVYNELTQKYHYYTRTDEDKVFIVKCSIVGLLHDVLEDTNTTVDELYELGCDADIVEAVIAVTRGKNESYNDFIERVIKNKIAVFVKLYDLVHNLDVKRLYEVTENDLTRINKYLRYFRQLRKFIRDNYEINLCYS